MALDDIRNVKIDKLKKLRERGIDPYPATTARTHAVGDALDRFDELAKAGKELTLAGRIMALREHGGSLFFDLHDGSEKMQAYLKEDDVEKEQFAEFRELIDIGDFVEVTGTLFLTKKNERTLQVRTYRLLSKAIRPLPEKWHGLQDVEERYRKRYLDFMLNPEARRKLITRSEVINALRDFMNAHEFLEVETPMLQTVAGGANAKKFKTKLDTLDLDVYLRVAPELFLKRLLVGGFERVFEFGKNFRNEGMDKDHNPEFSELEFYIAYKDYEWMMVFTEELIGTTVKKVFGTTKITYEGNEIDFAGPYSRVTFNELLKKHAGLDYDETDEKELAGKARNLGITIEKAMTKGNIADEIYKKVARPTIIRPTFVIDHPVDISPLSKKIASNPSHVARFQLLAGGHELVNAFSELNDPVDQKERFEAQLETAQKGNMEAHPYDADYVEALEYGMPPAAGFGLGIDRFVALLTDSHSIREVMAFPLMKPKA